MAKAAQAALDAEWPDPAKYLFISLEQKRKDQAKPYDGKKMFWIPDDKECYVLANLIDTKGEVCSVEVIDGGDKVSRLLPHLCPLSSHLFGGRSYLDC